MKWINKNRYVMAFVFSLIIFMGAIVLLHSYYNLKNIVQPVSSTWGRTTSLGAVDLYKKKPSIIVNDKYAEILAANKNNFTHVTIDRTTRAVKQEIIKLKDVESYKVQKFQWDEKNIYFIESNSLFFASKNPSGGYSYKTKIADETKDFEIINSKKGTMIAAAGVNGIVIYKEAGNSFQQYGDSYKIDKISNLAVVEDRSGSIHVAAYGEFSGTDFPLYYLTFNNDGWSLHGSAAEKILSESWSVSDIDIGIDDTDVYIFCGMTKWDKNVQTAKIQNAVVPLNKEKVDLKFNRFYISEQDAKGIDPYLTEAQIVKTQENEVKLTVIKNTYDKKYKNGFSGYNVTMDNGLVTDAAPITRNQRLVSNTSVLDYNGDVIYVFLDAAGGFNYEAFYTETGKAYFENAAEPTREDISIAVMDTIPGYVSSIVVSLIKFVLYFMVVLWFVGIEFFEVKRFKKNPKLAFGIGLTIHLVIKLVTMGTYYTEVSIAQMPPMLTFAGAEYIYAIGVAVIALFIEKLLKKHKPDIGVIVEYLVFALIDIEFTNLLYATYLL